MMNKKKIVAVIQARLKSSRLPQKVLCKIGDYSIIEHVIRRVLSVNQCDDVVLAVPHEERGVFRKVLLHMKTYLSELSQRRLWLFSDPRVHEDDVLQRVVLAAELFEADVVVRVTGDCPLWCPGIGKSALTAFCHPKAPVDMVSTMTGEVEVPAIWEHSRPKTRCPDGTDTEVMRFQTLKVLDSDPNLSSGEREHVTLALYNESLVCVRGLYDSPYSIPGFGSCFKLSVDTIEDLVNVERVYRSLSTTEPHIPLIHAWR